jgi:restriction system protein
MSIPDYETLMLPLLRRLATGEQHVRQLSQSLAEEFDLTDEERGALIPSGRGVTVIHSRTGWAKTYLKAAGLVEQPRRGWVQITERGRDVLRAPPTRLDNAFLSQFAEFKAFRFPSENGASDDGEALARQTTLLDAPVVAKTAAEQSMATSPEERLDLAVRELRTALAGDLLSRVRRLDPTMFEQVIVDLLVRMGYGGNRADAARRIGRTGDGGIDGVIREDRLGLDVIYIQAKRYAAENSVEDSQ